MDKRYILGVSNFIADAKADVKDGNSVFYPCKDWINQRKWEIIEYVRMHLITRGFIPKYTIWSTHGENVAQENNDDVLARGSAT